MNFPFIGSNIPAAPAYGVYISQMIRYSRACGSYQDILDRGLLLTRKLLNQGFLLVKLKSLCHYASLVVNTSWSFPHSRLITGFVTRLTRRHHSGTGTANPSGAPGFIPGFWWGSCYSIYRFICMFCGSLFVLLYFFFRSLCFLSFFDIRTLIAPLVF